MARYQFHCENCEQDMDLDFPIGTRPDETQCPECTGLAKYVFIAPAIMTHSYLDGTRRKGWQDMREASKLNKLAANLDPNSTERKAIEKEVTNKLRVDIKRDVT